MTDSTVKVIMATKCIMTSRNSKFHFYHQSVLDSITVRIRHDVKNKY